MKRKEYMKKETDHHEGSVMVELSVLNREESNELTF